jgi:hypothetical protein
MSVSTQEPENEWKLYRTRFLVKAKQLAEPLSFENALGFKYSGKVGDYLVEWSYGVKSILPRKFFEDVYVPMGTAEGKAQPTAASKFHSQPAVCEFPNCRAAAG